MSPGRHPSWVLDALGIGRWSRNLRTGEALWDERMTEITGHAEPPTFAAWLEVLTHPDDRAHMQELARAAAAREPIDIPTTRIVRPDGELRWIRIYGRCEASPDDDPLYVGVALDVTENVLLERRLAEAERLESLGRFSAGVSHNFNNMLMVISACLETIRDQAPPDPQIARDLEDATEATKRATEVVAQIAQIARMSSDDATQPMSLRQICASVHRLVRHALPEHIALDISILDDAVVEVVPGSMEQVLQNLIHNARDALLTARTAEPKISVTAACHEIAGAPWAELMVADNGPGVDPAIAEQLFEPFVTTKGHRGTGLGLASSSAIVQRRGGHLSHRRGSSTGAEFLVTLPASTKAVADSAVPRPPSQLGGEGLRLLLIDDEQAILRAISSALGRAGYEVETATGRERVLALLEHESPAFDVVLLDRSLGTERGSDLLAPLRSRLPGARLLYFTGEPLTPEQLADVDGVIHKPIDLHGLLAAVRGAVAEP